MMSRKKFCSTYRLVRFFTITQTHLLYRADGDTCSTGHDEVAVLNVWSDLIQHEGNDVRLHSQEQDITFTDCLFVAGGEVNAQFLYL